MDLSKPDRGRDPFLVEISSAIAALADGVTSYLELECHCTENVQADVFPVPYLGISVKRFRKAGHGRYSQRTDQEIKVKMLGT